MINRRSIMAMLGLAPAAAVMPYDDIPVARPFPSKSWAGGNINPFEDDDYVSNAKRRLEAAEWAATQKLAPVFDITDHSDYEYGVDTMKSWSRYMKAVTRNKRAHDYYEKRRIEERRYGVARAIFIKMAPPHLRDFL